MSVFVSDPDPKLKGHHLSAMNQSAQDLHHPSSRSAHVVKTTLHHFSRKRGIVLLTLIAGLIAALFLLKFSADNRFLASGENVNLSLSTSSLTLPPNSPPFAVFVDVVPNGHQVTALDMKFNVSGATITDITITDAQITSPLTTILPETPPDPHRFIVGATCTATGCPLLTQTGKVTKLTVQPIIPSGQITIGFDTGDTLAASTTGGNSNVAGTLTGLTVNIVQPSPTPLPTPTPPTIPTPPGIPTPPPTGNNPPVIVTNTLGSISSNKTSTKSVAATDADNNTLTMIMDPTTAPSGMTLTNCKQTGNNKRLTCDFTGKPGQKGTFNVKFTVSDGFSSTAKILPLVVN